MKKYSDVRATATSGYAFRKDKPDIIVKSHHCRLVCEELGLVKATRFLHEEYNISLLKAKHTVEAIRRFYTDWPVIIEIEGEFV